uniref:Nuclear mitotic apparatus protein 1 n=1 Tax=Lepisosteus oculatus TaxID=7918 RepID=W5MME1_LEPOC
MALHETKEAALLIWINSLNLEEPVDKISNLQDGRLLVKLIYKLDLPRAVTVFLIFPSKGHCKYKPDQGAIVSWQNVLNGHNLEVELSKVVVLLLYYSNMCTSLQGFENLNYKTQAELASVLRFVLDNEDSLSLNDNLENFLKRKVKFALSSVSSLSSISDEDSPVFTRKRKPEVQFVDLQTVASSSVSYFSSLAVLSLSSPIQDILKTPQFQLRKLRKQLAEERNMRDELELELANSNKIITERETQLSLLQQRVQRLMRQSNEQSQESNELEDLRIKNESLLKRLQDILKQCQDLKTNKGQMERKIDQLTEENGNLSFQMRDVLDRLTKAQAAVDKLSDEQEISVKEWESRRVSLESELNQAIANKEDLSEQILILQGKISLLEDQLSKAQSQHREEGEVMGDVLKMESLRQEVADLAVKVSQLEDVIARLEEEKSQTQMELNTERIKFENEKSHLDGVISGLQQTLSDLKCEKETLERTSRERQEQLTNQIETLNMEIAKLSDIVHQRELEVKEMEKQEQAARETIDGLNKQVDDLGDALRLKEEEAVSNAQQWNLERQEASVTAARERDAALAEYHHFQKAKEEEIEQLGQQILTLEDHQRTHQSLISELREEKQVLEVKVAALEAAVTELRSKCQSLEFENEAERSSHIQTVESLTTRLQDTERTLHDYKGKLAHQSSIAEENNKLHHQLAALEETVVNLRAELEAERKRFEETRVTDLQRISQMGEEVQDLASKNQRMSAELELVQKELLKEKQGKLTAESSLENLREEGIVVTTKLTTERDQAYFVIKEKEQAIQKLNSEVGALEGKLALTEETKIQELAAKKEEIERLISKTEQSLLELETVKKAKENADVHLQSTIEEHQNQLSTLSQELNDVRATLKQKESKLEALQALLEKREEEIKSLQSRVLELEQACAEQKQHISALEKELAEAQRLVVEKTSAFEAQTSQLLDQHQDRVVSLEQCLESSESICSEQKRQVDKLSKELEEVRSLFEIRETALKEERTSLQLEIEKQKRELDVLKLEEQQERDCLKNQVVATVEELQKLQAESLVASSLISEKDNELEDLKKELQDVNGKLQVLQYRDDERTKLTDAKEIQSKELENTIEQLRGDVLAASSLASEKQGTMESLEKELNSLKQDIEKQRERELLSCQAVAAEESKCRQLEATISQLRSEVNAASSLVSERELELTSLQEEIKKLKEQEDLRSQEAAKVKAQQKELQGTIERLQTEVQESCRRVLEDKVTQLEAQVLKASSLASERELKLNALLSEIKEKDNLRSQAISTEEAQQNALEEKIEKLQSELLAATSLASEGQSAVAQLQAELKALKDTHVQLIEKDELRSKASACEEHEREQLRENIDKLQAEVLAASALAAEREQRADTFQKKLDALQQLENEKLVTEKEALRKELSKAEAELSDVRLELTKAQTLIAELLPAKRKCQQQQAELCLAQAKHQEELEQRERAVAALEDDLQQVKEELSTLRPLREMTSEQDRAIQKLQEENAAHKGQVCKLQQINSQLTSENLEICSESSLGARRFDAELAVERESHSFALEKVRTEYQKQIAALKEDVLEGKKRQDVLTEKYESIKKKVLSDRQKFQDERQKLVIQVDELMDRLATAKSEQNNVKPGTGAEREQNEELQKQTSELQEQLTHKDGALEHYKAQVEKAKTHYGAKKQQLQEATEQIQALEKKLEGSQQENNTLKAEQKQLVTELQQAQLSIKKLSSKVSSLQAQVDLADRQLREQKFQAGSNTTKNHVSECSDVPEKTQETSKDSLDLSLDDSLNSTRKPSTSTDKTTPPVRSSERLAAKRRLLSGESLETLYFTPMMVRAESKLESSIASLGELTLDSAKKSRSARRRTTQIINITLTKKTPGAPEPESVNSSFYSLQSAQSHPNLFTQTQKSRPVSMASLSSRLNASQEFLDNEISASESLFNLPGYRPGAASTVTARRSTNAFVAGAQNEPEHTEDWMRIAELQTRNKSCLPHLKSSYPLENRPSINIPSFCISDDDVKLGDPDETIRRASMLPGQISEGLSSHRASMLPQPSTQYSWRATGDVSQQLKRCSNVPQEGGDTPESKKMMTACFPRPMTPKDKNDRRFTVQNAQNRPPSCQDGRRESVMFSVANTPKKKGGSLLQRSMSKIRNSTRKSPGFASKTPRRSPRISSSKSPKNAASIKKMSRKPMKNMKI